MTTISRARAKVDARSGGKVIRQRRIASAKTPYDRPTPPSPPPPTENPNWFTGLVFPATRIIASGAGKLLSSVFSPETWSSSSSSSCSSLGDDSVSEDDVGGDYDIPCDGVGGSKKNGTSSEMIKYFRREPQITVGKSETKRVIEQLLIHETFSREECDRLIEIISSRVVDCSSIAEGLDARLSEIPSERFGDDPPDLRSKALMEAKKWLEEKKVGSSSKSELDRSTCAFNSFVLDYVAEGEVGSPVDMAKSYMQGRPPWSSPTVRHIESGTPSSMEIELFKEGTHYPLLSNSSSAQKKDSLAAGSWNIQEEIRRVRSKATENMLRTTPSTKIDLSTFGLGPKSTQNSLVAETIGGNGDKMHKSISLEATEPTDASVTLAVGVSTCHGFPGHSALEMTQGGSQNEVLSSKPPMIVSEPKQDLKSVQIVEEGGVASKSHHSIGLEFLSRQHTATDPRSSDGNISPGKDVTGFSDAPNANGLPSSKSSLSAGLDVEQNPRQSDADNLTRTVPGEETCELLSEASIEVPLVNETNNSIASGSQNSSSPHNEELSQEPSVRVNVKRKSSGMVEKPKLGKKPNRYQRKGRGRGGK